jgi:DNA-binding PadR family transcriptional regulator
MAQTHNLILRIVAQRGEIGSAELMRVLEKFGRSPDAARAALNRMVQAEILTKVGQGRGDHRYRLGPQGQALVEQFMATGWLSPSASRNGSGSNETPCARDSPSWGSACCRPACGFLPSTKRPK